MSAAIGVLGLLRRIERLAARGQGKGWGAATLDQEVDAALGLLKRAPLLAVDVGGNEGLYTEALLKRQPGLEVHVFEPAASNLALLKQRFAGRPQVHINPQALSDAPGAATLFADRPGSGLGSLSQRRVQHHGISFNQAQAVQCMRFEEHWNAVLARRPICLAKLDIEGHELAALRGFGEALRHTQVLQFEFGGANIDTRTYLQDFHYFFAEQNFVLHRIGPLGCHRLDRYRESDECFTTTNFIAVNQARVAPGE